MFPQYPCRMAKKRFLFNLDDPDILIVSEEGRT